MTAELGKPNTPIAISSCLNYWLLGSGFLSLVSPCQDGCSLVGDRSTVKESKKDSWENQLFKAMKQQKRLILKARSAQKAAEKWKQNLCTRISHSPVVTPQLSKQALSTGISELIFTTLATSKTVYSAKLETNKK